MGPTINDRGRIVSFAGVKGGVGCSSLAALLSRTLAKSGTTRVAFIDATPSTFSLTPLYLGISAPSRSLGQLHPYQNSLNQNMVKDFFTSSPEGVAYVPLQQNDGPHPPLVETFQVLRKLTQWFDVLLLDLSSFPNDQHPGIFEESDRTFFVSSFEAASLAATKQLEKRLLPFHFKLEDFGIIFNQKDLQPSIPNDLSQWTQRFTFIGTSPFWGADLALKLLENQLPEPTLEKNLLPLREKLISILKTTPALQRPTSATLLSGSRSTADADEDTPALDEVHELHQELLERLRKNGALSDPKDLSKLQRHSLEPVARTILDQLIQEMKISNREMSQKTVAATLDLAFGLGPLEPFLQDGNVTEIMVNGPEQIFVEKKGKIERTKAKFFNEQQLFTAIERILAPIGRRIDESQPYVDGRLSDGSRVNAIIPPISLTGPVLTVRKFSDRKLEMTDLVQFGSLTQEAADFLGACVKARKNIIVSGGTGSGKTTLLNVLSNFIPSEERIVTIEDSAELRLNQEHVVRLESRAANLEGRGRISIRDLVINALRMRPDRIVVGECRGGEALDMLQAMNTGHDGSLTTAHANSPRDSLTRLETMVLLAGFEIPLKAIREQISRAVHLVVQQSRFPDGGRGVTQISEIQGMEGDVIIIQDIFKREEGGLVRRPFAPTFIRDLNAVGYKWPGHTEKIKA